MLRLAASLFVLFACAVSGSAKADVQYQFVLTQCLRDAEVFSWRPQSHFNIWMTAPEDNAVGIQQELNAFCDLKRHNLRIEYEVIDAALIGRRFEWNNVWTDSDQSNSAYDVARFYVDETLVLEMWNVDGGTGYANVDHDLLYVDEDIRYCVLVQEVINEPKSDSAAVFRSDAKCKRVALPASTKADGINRELEQR